jgi:putative endonuclease
MYFVYILKCKDNSLYTGITKDIKKRLNEHNNTKKAAKYTKSRRPVSIAYFSILRSKSEALKEEIRIKRMSRGEKIKLILDFNI